MTTKKYYSEHREEMIEKAVQWEKNHPKHKRKYNKKWCKENPEKIRASVKKRQERNRQYAQNYKLSKGCSICGYNKCASALDFHHKGDKEFSIAHMVNSNWSLKKIIEEIDKCVILCANCHRELHVKEKIGEIR